MFEIIKSVSMSEAAVSIYESPSTTTGLCFGTPIPSLARFAQRVPKMAERGITVTHHHC
jgi:hypothetical protein